VQVVDEEATAQMLLYRVRWRGLRLKSWRYESGYDYGEFIEESHLDRRHFHVCVGRSSLAKAARLHSRTATFSGCRRSRWNGL